MEKDASIRTDDFRVLNRCLDDAIAGAVTEYGRERYESALDGDTALRTDRLGFLAHELRKSINTAVVAFQAIRSGNVGVAGSTGTLLQRSLMGLDALIGRSLAEVRLTQGIRKWEQLLVSEFIEALTPAAVLAANDRGVALSVRPVEDGVAIEADQHILAAAVGDLLQNAFKFTKPRTTVTLRVGASAERVLIEIQDECGGLAGGDVTTVLRPFDERSAEGTGLGLGLAFCRWAVEVNSGLIYARTLPDRGCVFTIDLPRLPAPTFAIR